ncbi:hypothetical protein R1flu_008720 [Riccia fluitans]|uniref:Uncharacterized protein n=1 Tax=Riccia fluitans TaxID=41844 RepID=A0ABD1YCR6_9MARC
MRGAPNDEAGLIGSQRGAAQRTKGFNKPNPETNLTSSEIPKFLTIPQMNRRLAQRLHFGYNATLDSPPGDWCVHSEFKRLRGVAPRGCCTADPSKAFDSPLTRRRATDAKDFLPHIRVPGADRASGG